MRQLNNIDDLKGAIEEMEQLQQLQKYELQQQFEITKQSLKPINIIKSSFRDFKNDPQTQNALVKSAAGVGLGLLTKNLFVGKSSSIIKNLLGGVIETGVKGLSANNKVSAYAVAIYNNLFRKKKGALEDDE